MRQKWIIVGVSVAVLLAAGGGYYYWRSSRASAQTLPSDTYKTTATKGDITQSVACTGTVISNLDVLIKCRASGQITKLPFDISDHVKKGDLLLQLDPIDEQRLADQAEATVAIAQSKLNEAKLNERVAELDLQTATAKADSDVASAQVKATNSRNKANRQQQLLEQKLTSQEDYETAQTDAAQAEADLQTAKIAKEQLKSQAAALEVKKEDITLAEAQLRSDQIALANAKQQLDYTTLLAPMDGVVADLPVEQGTIISSAISNVGGGTTVMTLSDLSKIFVNAAVDESDIGGVQVGQKVQITADAFPGRRFAGTVVRIATQGVNVSNVVTFEVKIEVTGKNKPLLKPQMTTNVQIIEGSKSGVVLLPMQAVFRKEHKTLVSVVKGDGTTEDREVQTGIDDGNNEEIVSGINVGDTVLVHRNESNSRWSGGPNRPPTFPPGGGGRR
ncbi:MAG: efflux RND transporter periplasmic adaptor subunit [Tepidisphaeraceae bacterium]|jgi:HlyD family secretion protein